MKGYTAFESLATMTFRACSYVSGGSAIDFPQPITCGKSIGEHSSSKVNDISEISITCCGKNLLWISRISAAKSAGRKEKNKFKYSTVTALTLPWQYIFSLFVISVHLAFSNDIKSHVTAATNQWLQQLRGT